MQNISDKKEMAFKAYIMEMGINKQDTAEIFSSMNVTLILYKEWDMLLVDY